MTKYTSKEYMKYCNLCGSDCLDYTVVDNGIVCADCLPKEKPKKIIPNEKTMITKILEQKKL